MKGYNLNLTRITEEEKLELVNLLNDYGKLDYQKDWSLKMLNIPTHQYLTFDLIQDFRICGYPITRYKTIGYNEFRQLIRENTK